jgi:membrane protein YqaA with SNARE-associated domain
MLRRFYDWSMRMASHRYALAWLVVISAIESSIFPISPDLLIVPMAIARPQRAGWIALAATTGSLIGGLAGYAIGHFLFDAVGLPLIHFYGAEATFGRFRALYDNWGVWVVAFGGFTPMFYKVVTIASGAMSINVFVFALTLAISRGLHFSLVAGLTAHFGLPIRRLIDDHLVAMTVILLALLLCGFLIFRYVA